MKTFSRKLDDGLVYCEYCARLNPSQYAWHPALHRWQFINRDDQRSMVCQTCGGGWAGASLLAPIMWRAAESREDITDWTLGIISTRYAYRGKVATNRFPGAFQPNHPELYLFRCECDYPKRKL